MTPKDIALIIGVILTIVGLILLIVAATTNIPQSPASARKSAQDKQRSLYIACGVLLSVGVITASIAVYKKYTKGFEKMRYAMSFKPPQPSAKERERMRQSQQQYGSSFQSEVPPTAAAAEVNSDDVLPLAPLSQALQAPIFTTANKRSAPPTRPPPRRPPPLIPVALPEELLSSVSDKEI